MHWNAGLAEARHHHMDHVFSDQHISAGRFSWQLNSNLSKNVFVGRFWQQMILQVVLNVHDHIFHLVSNKVLIETIITAGDIFRYLSAWKTLWNIQYLLSELYFEQIVSYIENHIFIQYSNIIHSLTSEYKSHCQLSKFTIREMSFKTKVNSLVNKWELADGAWLNNQRNDGRNTGGHKWPETFWSVYTGTALYNNYIDGTPVSNY